MIDRSNYHGSEKQRAAKRTWYARNKQKVGKQRLSWRIGLQVSNPEEYQKWREACRKTCRASRDKSFRSFLICSISAARDRDQRSGFRSDLNPDSLLRLLSQQKFRCGYCGVLLTHRTKALDSVSIDRLDSAQGHTMDNVHLTCQFCNLGKRNRSHDQVVEHMQKVFQKQPVAIHSLSTYSGKLAQE